MPFEFQLKDIAFSSSLLPCIIANYSTSVNPFYFAFKCTNSCRFLPFVSKKFNYFFLPISRGCPEYLTELLLFIDALGFRYDVKNNAYRNVCIV